MSQIRRQIKRKRQGNIGFKNIGFRTLNGYYRPEYLKLNTYDAELDIWQGLTIKFFDQSGYLLNLFSNSSNNFPFSQIEFSNIQGGSPFECSFSMTRPPEDFEFKIEYGYFIQIFLFGSTTPFWLGSIVEVPSEILEKSVYSFKAEGLYKALENTLISQTYTGQTVSQIIDDLAQEFPNQIPFAKYDSNLIEDCPQTITQIEFDNQTGQECIKKLNDIAVNYEYGYNENGFFFFRQKKLTIDPEFIFFSGVNIPQIKLDKSGYSNIKNKIAFTVKKNTGVGMVEYNLTANQLTSQSIYGIKFEKISLPDFREGVSELIAYQYATAICNKKAFPDYKCQITGLSLLKFPSYPLYARGLMRVFGAEKWNFDTVDICENATNWAGTVNFTTTNDSTLAHNGLGSIKITSNTSALNNTCTLTFPSVQNFKTGRIVSFWIRANKTGTRLKVGIGKTAINDIIQQDINIINSNIWQQEKINIVGLSNLEGVKYFTIQNIDASENIDINIDMIEIYRFGRKKYEMEITKINYILSSGKLGLSIEGGSIDYPISAKLVQVIRDVEAIKGAVQ